MNQNCPSFIIFKQSLMLLCGGGVGCQSILRKIKSSLNLLFKKTNLMGKRVFWVEFPCEGAIFHFNSHT